MKYVTWAMLLFIVLVGASLRFVDLAQIPPGLYHDEAYSGLDALAIVQGAGLPIFFEGNGGREPFFIYLHALSLVLFGISSFSLRLPAAMVGVLTLPIFFVLVRALNARRTHSTWVALIATAGLATSYWHLNFSRMGWRTISLPLFACLAFYFFWRARNMSHWHDYLLAGIFLGAGLYTYLSARFLPIVIASFWLIEIAAHLRSRRDLVWSWRIFFRNAAIVVGASVVVFLPLAFYFIGHPQALLFRVSDVTLAGQGDPLQAIVGNVFRVAQMFYSDGDVEWRHGIAHRPVLDGIIGIPFALGLFVAAWRWRKPESWFAFLWLGIMLLPTILSKDAPDLQRAIGALPALYLFVAWGLAWLGEMISARISALCAIAMPAIVAWVLIGSGAISFRDYFVVWANDRRAYEDYQGGLVEFAESLNMGHDAYVVLPAELYAHPTIHFLTLSQYSQVRSIFDLTPEEQTQLRTSHAFAAIPDGDSTSSFVLLHGDQVILLDPNVRATITPGDLRMVWRDKRGKTPIVWSPILQLGELVRATTFTAVGADFDHRLTLVGYAMERRITSGQPYMITLYWSSRAGIQQGIVRFAHLLDQQDNVVVGVDGSILYEFNAGLFPANKIIPDASTLKIDSALPPGKYVLEVGVFYPANGSRMPVWVNNVRLPDDRILFPTKVALPATNESPAQLLDVRFSDTIALDGVTLSAAHIQPGESFSIKMFWRGERVIDHDYTAFVHLLDDQGHIIAQNDSQPRGGSYPTSIWDAGERIQDEITLTVPTNVQQGRMKIAIGWYDASTGRRLAVTRVGQPDNDALVLDIPLELDSR